METQTNWFQRIPQLRYVILHKGNGNQKHDVTLNEETFL